eukprot:TRINITY_DN465_c1_g2_i1.p1 TRINITY_DN465_c1_g2~~TRINITY_DN465_c1_g2_i1.p1  ORF type:complete len:905 (+),score=145.94 TRINITY_DN465_c1_g2_i1:145-2859(+)
MVAKTKNRLNDPNLKWYRSQSVSPKTFKSRWARARDAVFVLECAQVSREREPTRMLMYFARMCTLFFNSGATDHLLAVLTVSKFQGIEIDSSFFARKVSRYSIIKCPEPPCGMIKGSPFVYNKTMSDKNVFITGLANIDSSKGKSKLVRNMEAPFLIRSVLTKPAQSDKFFALFSSAISKIFSDQKLNRMTIRGEAECEIVKGKKENKVVTLCIQNTYIAETADVHIEFWLLFEDIMVVKEPKSNLNMISQFSANPEQYYSQNWLSHVELNQPSMMCNFSSIQHLDISPELKRMIQEDPHVFDGFDVGCVRDGVDMVFEDVYRLSSSSDLFETRPPSRKRGRHVEDESVVIEEEVPMLNSSLEGSARSADFINQPIANCEKSPFQNSQYDERGGITDSEFIDNVTDEYRSISSDYLMREAMFMAFNHKNGIIDAGNWFSNNNNESLSILFTNVTFADFRRRMNQLKRNAAVVNGTSQIKWKSIENAMIESIFKSNPKVKLEQVQKFLQNWGATNRSKSNSLSFPMLKQGSLEDDDDTHSLSGDMYNTHSPINQIGNEMLCQSLEEHNRLVDPYSGFDDWKSTTNIKDSGFRDNEDITMDTNSLPPIPTVDMKGRPLQNDLFHLSRADLDPYHSFGDNTYDGTPNCDNTFGFCSEVYLKTAYEDGQNDNSGSEEVKENDPIIGSNSFENLKSTIKPNQSPDFEPTPFGILSTSTSAMPDGSISGCNYPTMSSNQVQSNAILQTPSRISSANKSPMSGGCCNYLNQIQSNADSHAISPTITPSSSAIELEIYPNPISVNSMQRAPVQSCTIDNLHNTTIPILQSQIPLQPTNMMQSPDNPHGDGVSQPLQPTAHVSSNQRLSTPGHKSYPSSVQVKATNKTKRVQQSRRRKKKNLPKNNLAPGPGL